MSRPKLKTCERCNKKLYTTEESARKAIARTIKHKEFEESRFDYAIHVYRCPSGRQYHFGHDGNTMRVIEKMMRKKK